MKRNVFLHMNVRLNSPERAAIESLRDYEALSLSEALRLAIREAAARRGLWRAEPHPELLTQAG